MASSVELAGANIMPTRAAALMDSVERVEKMEAR